MHPNPLLDLQFSDHVAARQRQLLDHAPVIHLRDTLVPQRMVWRLGAWGRGLKAAGLRVEPEVAFTPEQLRAAEAQQGHRVFYREERDHRLDPSDRCTPCSTPARDSTSHTSNVGDTVQDPGRNPERPSRNGGNSLVA